MRMREFFPIYVKPRWSSNSSSAWKTSSRIKNSNKLTIDNMGKIFP